MTSIRIAETVHPLHATKSNGEAASTGFSDGIYNMRDLSRTSSRDKRSIKFADKDAEDDDPGLRQAGDYKTRQVFHGKYLLWLSYQSIGVIYGDIGTSPLYVYSSTFREAPSYEDLVGVLSIIIWSLTMMVTLKYVLIILHADNDGEGGTFSTYSLLSRYVNITNRDPREASLIQMRRYLSGDLESSGRHIRHGLERSKFAKALLKTIGVLAVSMVISDGVLTPAQSVLGAVQGLNVVDPSISNGTVVGVTAAILILLFMIQPLGTTKIAAGFAPIVIIWLAFNAAFGIYNLVKFDHSVLKAFDPGHAFDFLIRHKTDGWKMLGGVLLAFTGVEALFADLGAFSRKAIQISWLCYTFPCLLLAYIGQAAYISVHPSAYTNPFYNAVPPGTLYPALIIAILAAIVASQAIITATFQLLAQIMKLSYFPQIKVVHTSKTFHGQLYVPMMNWLLMIGTVLVAAIYNNTVSLGNAYGVCVMFVTFFDTCMVSLAAMFVWRIRPYWVFFPWLTIACLDGVYLSSALTKVPDGAWFTITLATVLACCFILWRFGKEQQWAAEAADRFPTSHVIRKREDGQLQLTDRYGGGILSTIPCFGIYFDKAGETTPIVFSQWLTKLVAAPEVIVLFHLRPLETPSVVPENRYTVSRLSIPNCYRLIVRHGYNDEVITPDLASLIYEQVRSFVVQHVHARGPLNPLTGSVSVQAQPATGVENARSTPITSSAIDVGSTPKGKDPESSTEGESSRGEKSGAEEMDGGDPTSPELAKLEDAYSHRVLYIIGKEQMKIKASAGIFRKVLLRAFLWVRDNTRTKIANLRVPTDRVIEVGFVKARSAPASYRPYNRPKQPLWGPEGMETGGSAQHLQDLRLDTSIKDFGARTISRGHDEVSQDVNTSGIGEGSGARSTNHKYNHSGILSGSKSASTIDEPDRATDTGLQSSTDLQPSSIDNYLLNRRPSINFDPHVTLDSGHRQSMKEPLQKPAKVRPRGRSLLQAISDQKSRSARAHSESDRTHYDLLTGEPLPKYAEEMSGSQQPHIGELRHPLLPSTVDQLARESQIDLTNSVTSQSTISPSSDEVRTPQDQQDFYLSPAAQSPPQYPASYEDTTPWQQSRGRFDRAQTTDFSKRMGSMRTALRQPSRRSTSSSTKSLGSAASSWLRGFSQSSAPESAIEPTYPESEGQTIGDDYVLGRQIGYGGFSTIHEVTQMISSGEQRKLAVKIVRKVVKDKSADENEQLQAEFGHEVELWRLLHHRYILPLEAVWHTDEATYCFIPLNKGGTLFDLVRSNRSGVPTHLAKRYSYQLAVALRYLHYDARVAHRDVKLENCLLDTTSDPAEVRLCDFGMAEWISNDHYSSSSEPPSPSTNSADRPRQRKIGPAETSSLAFAGGSLDYAAPETLRIAMSNTVERAVVTPVIDMWAYGVCVYTMVVGSRPFYHKFRPRISAAILAGDWCREELLDKGGQNAFDLVQTCLQMDPEKRWDADEVLRCAWLKDVVDANDEQDDSFGSDWKL